MQDGYAWGIYILNGGVLYSGWVWSMFTIDIFWFTTLVFDVGGNICEAWFWFGYAGCHTWTALIWFRLWVQLIWLRVEEGFDGALGSGDLTFLVLVEMRLAMLRCLV